MLIGSSGDFGHQEEEECEGRAKYRMMEVEEGKMVHLSSCCVVALSLLFLSYLLLPVHSVQITWRSLIRRLWFLRDSVQKGTVELPVCLEPGLDYPKLLPELL